MKKQTDFIVVLTSGKQDRGTRATLAFGWACAALAMDKTVSIYLTMEGTYWASKTSANNVTVEGFEPLAEYIKQFFELEGTMMVCAPCTEYYCSGTAETREGLFEEAQLTGMGSIVAMVGPSTSVITF